MDRWPEITEPLLRERQAMSDEEFFAFLTGLLEHAGARTLDDAHYEQAIGYPWARPPGSSLVSGTQVETLVDIPVARREEIVREYLQADDRLPLLAYGANASPERLALKLAHLDDEHRRALILAGELADFDVAPTAQGPWFSSMPATLVPSPGTTVRVGVLFLTPVQFTTLWWTEVSYKLGELDAVSLTTDVADVTISRVLAFISRFGAFCVDGEPVVLAPISARNRRWTALTQAGVLDAAARLTLGDDAAARDLIRAAYERPTSFIAEHFAALRAASLPFESAHWTEMPTSPQ